MKPILPFLPEGLNEFDVLRRSSAGLRTCRLETFLLAVASQFAMRTSACFTAFVPAYRCGTVPDSHRIPLTDNVRSVARIRAEKKIGARFFVIKPNPHMESQNGQRQLVCESCGATFGCCPVPNSGCWCADVAISDAARAELKTKFAECICPACLTKYAQKEPTAQA